MPKRQTLGATVGIVGRQDSKTIRAALNMLTIDPKTVIFYSAILSGLMTLILLTFRSVADGQVKGTLNWATGTASFSVACILYLFRGVWPDLISIVLGNSLYLFAASCWVAGTLRFHGVDPRSRWLALLCVAMTLLIAWFTLASPNYQIRLVAFTAVSATLYGIQAVVSFKYREKGHVYIFFNGALITAFVVTILRCISGLLALEDRADFLSQDWMQITYLLFASSIPLVLSTGFFMIASRKIQHKLVELARIDSLTGILNRRAFLEVCEGEHTRHRRHNRDLSVILIDIDHFKQVNDTYGHAAGDLVLKGVCTAVQGMLRKSDSFGRIGGEEFALLLPETCLVDAHCLAERIRNGVAVTQMGHNLQVTLSLGVTKFDVQREKMHEVISRADAALYRAKVGGRNRTELATFG